MGTVRSQIMSPDMISSKELAKNQQNMNADIEGLKSSLAEIAYKADAKNTSETDDTARLQRAIDKLSTGDTLLLSAQTYQISSKLNWKSDINIVGKGDKTVIQAMVGSLNVFDLTNLSNVNIKNLQVKGVTGNGTGKGILLNNSVNCNVENVTVDTFENQGVLLSGTSTNNRLMNVRSKNTVGSPGNGGCGVILFGTDVKNNFLDKIYCSGNRIGLSINGSTQNELGTIIVENNTQIGFTLDGIISGTGDGAKKNIIHSIIATNNSTSATAYYGGVYVGNGASDNIIHSIETFNNRAHGLVISAVSGNDVTKPSRNIFGKVTSLLNDQDGIRSNYTDKNIFNVIILDGNLKNGAYFNISNQNHIGVLQVFNHNDATDGIGLKIDGNFNVISELIAESNRIGFQAKTGNNGNILSSSRIRNNTTDIDDQAATVQISGRLFKSVDDDQFTFQAGRKSTASFAWVLQSLKADLGTYSNRMIVSGGEDTASITIQNAYFKMATLTSLPAVSTSLRGRMIRIEGGTGVADGLYICQKNASDTYEWKQIS